MNQDTNAKEKTVNSNKQFDDINNEIKKPFNKPSLSRLFFELGPVNSRVNRINIANEIFQKCFTNESQQIILSRKKYDKVSGNMNYVYNRMVDLSPKDSKGNNNIDDKQRNNNEVFPSILNANLCFFSTEIKQSKYLNKNDIMPYSGSKHNINSNDNKYYIKGQPNQKATNIFKRRNMRIKDLSPVHSKNNSVKYTELKPHFPILQKDVYEKKIREYEMHDLFYAAKQKAFKF